MQMRCFCGNKVFEADDHSWVYAGRPLCGPRCYSDYKDRKRWSIIRAALAWCFLIGVCLMGYAAFADTLHQGDLITYEGMMCPTAEIAEEVLTRSVKSDDDATKYAMANGCSDVLGNFTVHKDYGLFGGYHVLKATYGKHTVYLLSSLGFDVGI